VNQLEGATSGSNGSGEIGSGRQRPDNAGTGWASSPAWRRRELLTGALVSDGLEGGLPRGIFEHEEGGFDRGAGFLGGDEKGKRGSPVKDGVKEGVRESSVKLT
jgi:hypothetical protein